MTELQKITLRLSELRQKHNELSDEYQTLETHLRALIIANEGGFETVEDGKERKQVPISGGMSAAARLVAKWVVPIIVLYLTNS